MDLLRLLSLSEFHVFINHLLSGKYAAEIIVLPVDLDVSINWIFQLRKLPLNRYHPINKPFSRHKHMAALYFII